jgi:hypothetical protein
MKYSGTIAAKSTSNINNARNFMTSPFRAHSPTPQQSVSPH